MVKGIDAQHLVTQTYVTEKVQQVHQRQADLQQRYFDVQLAEERKQMQEKIKRAEDADKAKITEQKVGMDKEHEKGKEKGRRREPDQEPPDDEEKHMIDVKA
ncbi:MAG: hypothetical protein CSYNP_01553 [Syntrophus sp. SKADARSKE-3]|nr:hypothetical protein [Syntrophus sp. SKADARSKE-3]